MQAAGSVSATFAGLVHPPARRGPLQQLQQQDFIASKLVFVALALAGAPIFVAARGAPSPGEAGIFTLVLLQLAPAMMVTRRGWLVLAQELGVLGLLGIGAIAALLPGVHPLAAAAWFAAAAVDALIGCGGLTGRILAASGIVFSAAAAAAAVVPPASVAPLAMTAALAMTAPLAMTPEAAFIAAAALLPILAAAWRGRRAARAATSLMAAARNRHGLLAALGDAVAVDVDAAGRVEQASPNCLALLGITGEALQGRGLLERILVADRPAFLKLVSDAAHGAEAAGAAVRLRRPLTPSPSPPSPPSGDVPLSDRHAAVEVRAVADQDGIVLLLRDIEASAAREGAVAAADIAAAHRREGGLAGIGQELRTPLNAVIGFSEILASQTLRPAAAEKQREYAQIILASGRHILAMVDAISDMARGRAAGGLPSGATDTVGARPAIALLPPARSGDGLARPRTAADAAPPPATGDGPRAADFAPTADRRPTPDIRMKRSA